MTFDGPASQGSDLPASPDAGMLALADLINHARQQAEGWIGEDPVYAELMGTYAQLGETLMADSTDPWFESDCRSLVDRLIALGKRMDADMAHAIVAAMTRTNTARGAA